MAGCRSLTEQEVVKVTASLQNPRDRALFVLGLKTGFRLSELLSLTIRDVYSDNQVLNRVRVERRNTKGKVKSREVALHPMAKAALMELLSTAVSGTVPVQNTAAPLFLSRNGEQKPLSRIQAHKILKEAYSKAGLKGNGLASHCMRKSFAKKVYEALNHDLVATQRALGHADIGSTICYLSPEQDEIDAAILAV